MRRSVWMRLIAVVLIVSMLAVPVSAAGVNSRNVVSGWFNWGGFNWSDLFKGWFGGSQEEEETQPTEATEATEAVDSGENAATQLTLVEGQETVENPGMLRANTYALTSATSTEADTGSVSLMSTSGVDAQADEDTTFVKYFGVTMYDYDTDTINAATDAKDSDLTVREGIYFSGGSPAYTKETVTVDTVAYTVEDGDVIIADGTYLLYCSETAYYVTDTVNASSPWNTTALNGTGADDYGSATLWTFTRQSDGSYTIQNADGEYLTVTGEESAGLTTEENTVTIAVQDSDAYTFTVYDDAGSTYGYMNSLGATYYGVGYFGGWSSGSAFCIRSVPEGGNSIVAGYEAWNRWDKASGSNVNGQKIWTGLVQSTLVNDQIVFNVPDGGIFNEDTSVKAIYENVGLPFVYEDGYYVFDSDVNGVYFADTGNDGDADPQSGTQLVPYNMYFDQGNTQGWSGMQYGDGSSNLWAPFNTNSNDTSESAINYHFGMRADIPFSMTANGRIKSTDDESDPIKFTFSGDDDVWVFIDGILVIDLGGIHNRLDVTIDFVANTITYSHSNTADADGDGVVDETGSYNDPAFALTQKLFTDNEGAGLINMTREAFSIDEDHEMQVFYLERGAGASNCQITFNLPMNDTVLVTKDATQSWNPDTDEVENLTANEQAIVDNINFGFTLYKKAADDDAYTAVANTDFYLLDSNGELIRIRSTDDSGHFDLKNGQTAKFITEIPSEGVSYYVVEDAVPDGFVTPDFNFAGSAANGFSYLNADGETVTLSGTDTDGDGIKEYEFPEQVLATDATVNKSYEFTVAGGVESSDSIQFICSNYLNATIPNPSIFPNEDIIVIDYGLPVQIDPLANDMYRGDTLEILYVGGENVTLALDDDGNPTGEYTTDDTLHSGTVELVKGTATTTDSDRDTLVYTLNKQMSEVEVLTYVVKVTGQYTNETTGVTTAVAEYAIGKVYIVPATVMYYEENFSDFVIYTGSGWADASTVVDANDVSPYQEPGVVGTVDDSTYGSDVAYLSDSADSNGTHRYGDTTNGAIRFSYTFTGTGTSFFARTTATTGYMQVKIYEGEGTTGTLYSTYYRDTYWNDTNNSTADSSGTLYNIPVFSSGELSYGTYTVVVTVAKAGTKGAGAYDETSGYNLSGKDFYLDGIRVMQPLNESNETIINESTGETITDKALGAYATDGENNIDVVTLRNKIITDAETGDNAWNFVVLTDTTGEIVTADDYVSIGPKEEVYLMPGQSVTFAVKYWHQDGYLMHLGMKAPFGSASVQVGQNTYSLSNATDCYFAITSNYGSVLTKYEQATITIAEEECLLYTDANGEQVYEDADGYFYYVVGGAEVPEDAELTPVDDLNSPYYVAIYTITATDSIVALTNLKVTGSYDFVMVEDTDINVDGSDNG